MTVKIQRAKRSLQKIKEAEERLARAKLEHQTALDALCPSEIKQYKEMMGLTKDRRRFNQFSNIGEV